MTHVESPFDIKRLKDEWLEADGFGGFASGTVGMLRTRRYQALLLTATRAPAGRIVLVNGIEAWIETKGVRYPLSMQRYAPDIVYPDIAAGLIGFDTTPWPTWRFRIDAQTCVIAETFVAKATCETMLRWRVAFDGDARRDDAITLHVRPLLSGRDYHALHHETGAFDFSASVNGERVQWQPYHDLPAIRVVTNGAYEHAPDWYRNFCYVRERERGLDFTEDLATPGVFTFDLRSHAAVMILSADVSSQSPPVTQATAIELANTLAETETNRRAAFASRLHRSADAYVVARSAGRTIVAGFPWFTDWGRDTFIAMRGLLIATGRLAEAESILLAWAGTISQGMCPNRFPDYGDEPEYNSVDASLWFAIAVHDYLATEHASDATRERLHAAVDTILAGYTQGTRYGIQADDDGLLRAGVPGVQLTWMDAKVGDWVVTPRIGKPVEVQALWFNALRIAAQWNTRWNEAADRVEASFAQRFVDPQTGALFDNVDVDHLPGTIDRSIRPNQIFAAGGLPFALVEGDTARAVVAQVEAHLLTPLGLRTLSPEAPGYRGRYAGAPLERDGAYHQGTVWPWLLGPFVEAWLRVQRPDEAARSAARARFLAPLDAHLDRAGLDHISEVADGDAPHTPGGTPFQAWSLGERLRMGVLLGESVHANLPDANTPNRATM
ncbi:amylo-alpha-1,6-glucosidase [Paraburkholderia hospita]|uniref:Glycogen debranching protein n=1 Tax=Paraburkholderia hospita TaxID=169430 RepID=A0AAN1MJI6_9BURK|nr:amylo-alpha-1,6-glucosidase [Paraburkholderia hospita]AUT69340.1 glycogen debranching protein [Paraburkholderia hospita]SEI25620.1 glycogen debranching enzyme, putative [Paraburkholderia hospita]